MTFPCPVCDTNVAEELRKCSVCKWTFSINWGEPSQKEQAEYAARVAKARTEYVTKKSEFCAETPIPLLVRDPFETPEEFEQRLIAYPPILAGHGDLLREQYDIINCLFPVIFTSEKWFKNYGKQVEYALTLNRDDARDLYNKGARYEVFARLGVVGGQAIVRELLLVAEGQGYLLDSHVGQEWCCPITGMVFMWVPGGTFQMGDLFGDGSSGEKPEHEVRLDGFWLGKFPVTQGEWQKVMGSNPSHFKNGHNYPVEKVSWEDVQYFIKKLNKQGDGKYRMPSEAEWEYAARSGGEKERYAGGDDVDLVAWYAENSGNSTHPVGQKAPNGLGLFDMSGNVWEWVQDWYVEDAYSKRDSKGIYAGSGSDRVSRGGSWGNFARSTRCANRGSLPPDSRNSNLGARLARTF